MRQPVGLAGAGVLAVALTGCHHAARPATDPDGTVPVALCTAADHAAPCTAHGDDEPTITYAGPYRMTDRAAS